MYRVVLGHNESTAGEILPHRPFPPYSDFLEIKSLFFLSLLHCKGDSKQDTGSDHLLQSPSLILRVLTQLGAPVMHRWMGKVPEFYPWLSKS